MRVDLSVSSRLPFLFSVFFVGDLVGGAVVEEAE